MANTLKIIIKYLLCCIFVFNGIKTNAQGCSDAGFCTAGGIKAGEIGKANSDIRLGIGYGIGDLKVNIIQINAEWNWAISKNVTFQSKIPFTFTNGNLGHSSGLGDISASLTYSGKKIGNLSTAYILGTKIPTGKTDISYTPNLIFPQTKISMPMPYQTGLGTADIIAGGRLKYKLYSFAIGTQIVIYHDNKNSFLPELDSNKASLYFPSKNLIRGNDILIRAEKLFQIKKFDIEPGILAIYRLQGDKATNASGVSAILKGSEGLTLNITLNVAYTISSKIQLLITAGTPLIVRTTRADGLTRALVSGIQIKYQF